MRTHDFAQPAEPSDDALRARFDDAARPAAARDEIDWYVERLPRGAGLCLDAMCGSGRLLVPLLARGIAIQGADASGAALALAKARPAGGGRVSTLYGPLLPTLNLPTRYAAANGSYLRNLERFRGKHRPCPCGDWRIAADRCRARRPLHPCR